MGRIHHKVGPTALLGVRQLLGEDRVELFGCHAVACQNALALNVRRRRHHDDRIDPFLTAGFVQQRDIDHRYRRTGTLWEGRFKANLVDSERYLLTCYRYIEMNPVRAAMVEVPGDYRWSSHAHYAGIRQDRLVSPHALYWSLGNTPFAREAAYVELAQHGIGQGQQKSLTDSALKGWVLGEPEFVDNLQKQTSRRLIRTKAGRPRSKRPDSNRVD